MWEEMVTTCKENYKENKGKLKKRGKGKEETPDINDKKSYEKRLANFD